MPSPPHSFTPSSLHPSWDAVVIGGGPAGAVAALLLARAGQSVLLVDAKAFPRAKACGGCLNAGAVSLLRQLGLASTLDEPGSTGWWADAAPLRSIRIVCRRQEATWPLPMHVAVDRARFDHALVRAAVDAGATFLPGTKAEVLPRGVVEGDRDATERIGPRRAVLLQNRRESIVVDAQVVLCADGLSQSSLRRLPEFSSRVAPASRIGLAGTVEGRSKTPPPGTLTMAVGKGGYVGLARTGSGRVNVAAAVDAAQLARRISSGDCLRDILQQCSLPVPDGLDAVEWTGTPTLTRRRGRVAAERLFVIGDGAGYVEPFTGEGMASAMLSAVLVTPSAIRAIDAWHDSLAANWERQLQRKVFAKQWTCRLLAKVLRSPFLCTMALATCRTVSPIPRYVISRLNRLDAANRPLPAKSRSA